MNVELPRDLEKYVESLVQNGGYGASSEVIAEALRQPVTDRASLVVFALD